MATLTLFADRFHALANDLPFVSLCLAILALGAFFQRFRSVCSTLAIPIGLLALRQSAIYIPVPGAISTTDWVAFWSIGAFIYVLLMVVGYAFGIALLIFSGGPSQDNEAITSSVFFILLAELVLSGVFMPVDGWSHLYVPLITHVALLKVLIVHPMLVPLATTAIAAMLLMTVTGRVAGRREVNTLLLTLVVIGGVAQLLVQPTNFGNARRAVSPLGGESEHLLVDWRSSFTSDPACDTRVAAARLVGQCPSVEASARLSPWNAVDAIRSSDIFSFGGLFVVVAILVGALRRSDRAAGPGQIAAPARAIRAWQPLVLEVQRNRWTTMFGVAVIGLFGSVLAVMLAAASGVEGAIISAAVALSIACIGTIAIAITREDDFAARRVLTQFFLHRDQRGYRRPDAFVMGNLPRLTNQSTLLESLPLERRLTVRSAPVHGSADLKYATWLTLIDYVLAGAPSVPLHLPNNLWPSAVRALLAGGNARARAAGVSCDAARRGRVLHLCGHDSEETVRRAAWRALESRLSRREAKRLSRSTSEDIRLATLGSRALALEDVLRLASDNSMNVRRTAWRRLSRTITSDQARSLLQCPHADIRAEAVSSGKVDRASVLITASGDQDLAVRQSAIRVLGTLAGSDVVTLSKSPHSDIRRQAVESGLLTRRRLLGLLGDQDPTVRATAYERITQFSKEEIREVSYSKYADLRSRAAESSLLDDDRRLWLLHFDPDSSVRQAAWRVRFGDESPSFVEAVLNSGDREIRPQATRIDAVPHEVLVGLAFNDWQSEVREAAWAVVKARLRTEEAERYARSSYDDVRIRVASSGLLPVERLLELSTTDPRHAVRLAAWESLRLQIDRRHASMLSTSDFGDARLRAVLTGLLTHERLAELLLDPDAAVRTAARDVIRSQAGIQEPT